MKKAILIGFAFASVFTACKKNDDNSGTPVAQKKYLSREIWEITDTTDYSYDANKMLVKAFEHEAVSSYNTVFNYQDGKLITINSASGTDALQLRETYTYDGSGRVQKVIFGDGYRIDSITYNRYGTINMIYSFSSYYDINVPYQVKLYSWDDNGNITSVKQAADVPSLDNKCDYINTYSYDNKVNPRAFLPAFFNIVEAYEPSYISKNNLVKDVYQARSGGVLKEREVREFTYTYDSDGYPTGYSLNLRDTQDGPVNATEEGKFEYAK